MSGEYLEKLLTLNSKKLKEIVSKLSINKGMGVIIRTAGQSMSLKDIKRTILL